MLGSQGESALRTFLFFTRNFYTKVSFTTMPAPKSVKYSYFPTATSEIRFIGITGAVVGLCLLLIEMKCVEHKSAFADQYLGFWMGCLPAFCNGVLLLFGCRAKQEAIVRVSALRCFDTGLLATVLHVVLAVSSFFAFNADLSTDSSAKVAAAYSVSKFWLALFAFTFSMHQIVVLWRVKRYYVDQQQQQQSK